MTHASAQTATDAAGPAVPGRTPTDPLRESGLIMLQAVSADPLRHAPLVLELVHDRIGRPARGLDPMIVHRHGEGVTAQVAGLASQLIPDGATAHVAETVARMAIAQAIDHTHRIMMDMGHLGEPEQRGALASGRTLFASELGGAAASAMTWRH
jgi:hypothetical protein